MLFLFNIRFSRLYFVRIKVRIKVRARARIRVRIRPGGASLDVAEPECLSDFCEAPLSRIYVHVPYRLHRCRSRPTPCSWG